MRWEDIYPVMSEADVREFHEKATAAEKIELASFFEVEQVFNQRDSQEIVSISLFFKPYKTDKVQFPQLTEEVLRNARKLGLVERYEPWNHYVQAILDGAERLHRKAPEVTLRIYLANDLSFMLPHLLERHCEVFLMAHSSISMQPGMMWRFLAFEEEGKEITITDADRCRFAYEDALRTRQLRGKPQNYWRLAYVWCRDPVAYNPIVACEFGGRGGLPVRDLAMAYIWHSWQGHFQSIKHPVSGEEATIPDDRAIWPNYGFDERFIAAAIYPLMAKKGILTISEKNHFLGHWFAFDLQYCTRLNESSELIIFDDLT